MSLNLVHWGREEEYRHAKRAPCGYPRKSVSGVDGGPHSQCWGCLRGSQWVSLVPSRPRAPGAASRCVFVSSSSQSSAKSVRFNKATSHVNVDVPQESMVLTMLGEDVSEDQIPYD